jgi:hypothetical protein
MGYDVGSKLSRGRCHSLCFGLTADSTEAERAKLIAIILNVAAVMHYIFRCIRNIRND